MPHTNKKHLYIFGSFRKYQGFKKNFSEPAYVLHHLDCEKNGDEIKKQDELLAEFDALFDVNQEVVAFVSFGKGSLIGGIEVIAETVDFIKNNYQSCKNIPHIGPSARGAKIFCNKYYTHQALNDLNIPVPKTIEIDTGVDGDGLQNLDDQIKFPGVLKAENLSGGRGMEFVASKDELSQKITNLNKLGLSRFILSEYVSGLEVTFTVLRLGDTFLRLPASFKNETTADLRHPDTKVKVAGLYKEFNEYFAYVEKVMKEYDIYGLFSLQGVLEKNENNYRVKFLEVAPRMTGSTPIMEKALRGFDLFATMADWIKNRRVEFAFERQLAIQYSTYIHNGHETLKSLSEKEFIIEAKFEDLGELPYSTDHSNRIRISFLVEGEENLNLVLDEISLICGNKNFGADVRKELLAFRENHKSLLEVEDNKILEGNWGEDVKWEFYQSNVLPDKKLCTAVFGVPKSAEKIVLTKTDRGWELPGGHIEPGETILATLQRELIEETGFKYTTAVLFGYRKIISKKVLYAKTGEPYPFPVSYIPHFLVLAENFVNKVEGSEVLDAGVFAFDAEEVKESHVGNIINVAVEELGRIG